MARGLAVLITVETMTYLSPPRPCVNADGNGDAIVAVDDMILALNSATKGCTKPIKPPLFDNSVEVSPMDAEAAWGA